MVRVEFLQSTASFRRRLRSTMPPHQKDHSSSQTLSMRSEMSPGAAGYCLSSSSSEPEPLIFSSTESTSNGLLKPTTTIVAARTLSSSTSSASSSASEEEEEDIHIVAVADNELALEQDRLRHDYFNLVALVRGVAWFFLIISFLNCCLESAPSHSMRAMLLTLLD